MSRSAPIADTPPSAAPPAAATPDDQPPQEHWRGGLPALRAELDRIDDALHELLMKRALVVEQVARSGKPAAFRPGREASIIRRLLGCHGGSLPRQAVFRIWRELLAGTTAMQGPFVMAVCDADPGGSMTQLAREHFGTLTPLRSYGSPARPLEEVASGAASVAILPFPTDSDGWWVALAHHEPRLHVIARLPFWITRSEGAPTVEALVVAAFPPDPSGQDRSVLVLEVAGDVSRARLSAELTSAGLPPVTLTICRMPDSTQVLVEVEGFVADDDPRLDTAPCRPVVLGGYAVPVPGGAP